MAQLSWCPCPALSPGLARGWDSRVTAELIGGVNSRLQDGRQSWGWRDHWGCPGLPDGRGRRRWVVALSDGPCGSARPGQVLKPQAEASRGPSRSRQGHWALGETPFVESRGPLPETHFQ